jgi:hypothetical protein
MAEVVRQVLQFAHASGIHARALFSAPGKPISALLSIRSGDGARERAVDLDSSTPSPWRDVISECIARELVVAVNLDDDTVTVTPAPPTDSARGASTDRRTTKTAAQGGEKSL